jgi:hypothetical protein
MSTSRELDPDSPRLARRPGWPGISTSGGRPGLAQDTADLVVLALARLTKADRGWLSPRGCGTAGP